MDISSILYAPELVFIDCHRSQFTLLYCKFTEPAKTSHGYDVKDMNLILNWLSYRHTVYGLQFTLTTSGTME